MKLLNGFHLTGLLAVTGLSMTSPAHAMPSKGGYRAYLAECHAKHVCNGSYLVARKGKTVFAGAFGDAGDQAGTPLTVDSAFDIGSISKQFTAFAVLRLAAEGRLALDTRVVRYLSDFPYPDVTVAQLMSHSSGLPDAMPYYTKRLRQGGGKPVTGADIVSVLAETRMPAVAAPGAQFKYSNTGYMVLATLVERVSGMPFAVYLERRFFKPLGMKNTLLPIPGGKQEIRGRAFGFVPAVVGDRRAVDQIPGLFMRGAGGIYSTVPDLLRWQNAVTAGRVVPRRWVALARAPTRLSDNSTIPYGFGLALKPDVAGAARISHAGHWRAFKSDLSWYPGGDVTVIQLTNNGEDDSVDANAAALAMIAVGREPPPLREPIVWELARRVGDASALHRWFAEERAREPRRYDIQESALNALGYAYLQRKEAIHAVNVFVLATQAFPGSANAFDSLADAQEAVGDIRGAYESVQSAAKLEPGSASHGKRAEKLKARLR